MRASQTMNEKKSKKLRKEARKVAKDMLMPAAKELLIKAVRQSDLFQRIKFAVRILRGTL